MACLMSELEGTARCAPTSNGTCSQRPAKMQGERGGSGSHGGGGGGAVVVVAGTGAVVAVAGVVVKGLKVAVVEVVLMGAVASAERSERGSAPRGSYVRSAWSDLI